MERNVTYPFLSRDFEKCFLKRFRSENFEKTFILRQLIKIFNTVGMIQLKPVYFPIKARVNHIEHKD